MGRCSRFLASDCRGELLPAFWAEAISIFNKIGLAVSGEGYEAQELLELARRLEKWFWHYRRLWYTVSRERELRQVGDVIFKYCDILRDMAGKMK